MPKKILKIKKSNRYADLYEIIFEDNNKILADIDTLLSNRLAKGIELSESDYRIIENKSIQAVTKSHIKKFVLRKSRTEKELRLEIQKTDNTNIYDDFIEKLKNDKYIDDEKYAIKYIEYNSNKRNPKGKLLIINELRLKGIEQNIIYGVLKEYYKSPNLESYITKYLGKNRYHNNYEKKSKLCRHLLSKGFSHDEISTYIDSLLPETYDNSS